MFYTGKGDEGYTGLIGGERVTKESPRIEALGELDEAISAIGLARALAVREAGTPLLVHVQRELSRLSAEVASPNPERLASRICAEDVVALEVDIDELARTISNPHAFIVPGDSPGGGALHLARAVVRRAERCVTALVHHGEVQNIQLIRYLNRLSTLLYLLARADDQAAGVEQPTLMIEAREEE